MANQIIKTYPYQSRFRSLPRIVSGLCSCSADVLFDPPDCSAVSVARLSPAEAWHCPGSLQGASLQGFVGYDPVDWDFRFVRD